MQKTEFIRDIPVGVLLIILAQFFIYGVQYFAKFPIWWETLLIILFTLFANRLIVVGINLIKGVDVAESE